MHPDDVRRVLAERRRLILPAGALARRGPHLPLGADTLLLERLADDLSARYQIPRAPALEFGVHAPREEDEPGVAALTRKTLHRLVNELIAAWEEEAGVREITVLTAHADEPHQEALSTIRALGRIQLIDVLGIDFGELVHQQGGPRHGGEVDTSMLLHLYPGLVRLDLIIPGSAAATASPELGARLYAHLLETVGARCFGASEEPPRAS